MHYTVMCYSVMAILVLKTAMICHWTTLLSNRLLSNALQSNGLLCNALLSNGITSELASFGELKKILRLPRHALQCNY